MTREERFEQRLADWLEDGPYDTPKAVIDAVFEHARTHPRRRIGPSRLWKAVKAPRAPGRTRCRANRTQA